MPMNNVNIPGQSLHHIGFFRLGYAKKFWNTSLGITSPHHTLCQNWIQWPFQTSNLMNLKKFGQPFLRCFQRLHHIVHEAHLKPVRCNHSHIFYQLLLSVMPLSLHHNHFPNKAWLKHKKHLIPKSPYSICWQIVIQLTKWNLKSYAYF